MHHALLTRVTSKASASQLAAAEEALLQAGQADFMNGWNANSADLSKFEVPSMLLSQLHPKLTQLLPLRRGYLRPLSVRTRLSLALYTVPRSVAGFAATLRTCLCVNICESHQPPGKLATAIGICLHC